jgi:hypothetical protein
MSDAAAMVQASRTMPIFPTRLKLTFCGQKKHASKKTSKEMHVMSKQWPGLRLASSTM